MPLKSYIYVNFDLRLLKFPCGGPIVQAMKPTKSKKKDAGFSGRIRTAMKARGIKGPSELARRLTTRLGRTVNRQTVFKWMNGDVASIRADAMLAVAIELDYSGTWLTTGQGTPESWVAMDEKKAELCNVYSELTEAAKAELVSYAYRLMRVASRPALAAAPVPVPAKDQR